MWYLYIILCQDNSFYTGISPTPEKRFTQHKRGKGGKYTASHPPLKIIYKEELATKSDALKREYAIKQWTREQKIKKLALHF